METSSREPTGYRDVKVSRPSLALPGEKLAVIEEMEGGEGTYCHGGSVRALAMGRVEYDWNGRVVKLKRVKPRTKIPEVGDTVIGQVESVQSSLATIRIDSLNREANDRRFRGLLSVNQFGKKWTKHERMDSTCKLGDIVRAKVVSNMNAIIHLSIEGRGLGVIYTSCSICGSKVVALGEGVKCVDCGAPEVRKLASDFNSASLL